jgi:hypothetical protein
MKSKFNGMNEVAEKFREQLHALTGTNAEIEGNEVLTGRISEGARYFHGEWTAWINMFRDHPISTDLRKTARKIDSALEDINYRVHTILHRLKSCSNGFRVEEYLKKGKKPEGPVLKVPGCYAQDKIRNLSSSDLEHAELYNKISAMRNRIGRESGLPLYRIFTNNAIKNVCVELPADTEYSTIGKTGSPVSGKKSNGYRGRNPQVFQGRIWN